MKCARIVLWATALVVVACASPEVKKPREPGMLLRQVPGAANLRDFGLEPVDQARSATQSPIALVAGDGNPLTLRTLSAESVIVGPLAFTELKLVFSNPASRTIEGQFQMTLPSGASVSRFAMKIGSEWQEGEVVARARAQRIYEDFLHRRVDPALLEQGVGNSFSARVFPITANERKELIISYSQPVRSGDTLVPLAGLAEIHDLDVVITHAGETKRAHFADHVPAGDVVAPTVDDVGLRAGRYAVARVSPVLAELADASDPLGPTLVLLDTSASSGLSLERGLARVETIADRVADRRLVVAVFDQEVAVVHRGAGADWDGAERVRRRRALGASDLGKALSWVSEHAAGAGIERVVIVSDGVVTAGHEDRHLLDLAQALSSVGVQRIDAVVVGGLRDEDALHAIVTAGERAGVVVSAENELDRLERRTRSDVALAVAGASWWWPSELDGVQAGDTVTVVAELPAGEPAPAISVDGAAQKVTWSPGPANLVGRAWAEGRIASLLEEERRGADHRAEIVGLSIRHRVLSPHTAMLVLETQADYDRYELDRSALADILTVRDGRLATIGRPPLRANGHGTGAHGPGTGVEAPAPERAAGGERLASNTSVDDFSAPPPPSPSPGQGSTHGRIGRSHRARAPRVRMGATNVSGRLPPEVIQRLARQSFGRFRKCYEQGLQRNPALAGRVAVRFVIGRDGKVSSAVAEPGFPDEAVATCVANEFAALTFPEPVGGIVTVLYPIVFSPDPAGPTAVATTTAPPLGSKRHVRSVLERSAPIEAEEPQPADPYSGLLKEVMANLAAGEVTVALEAAQRWHASEPGSLEALVALGESLEAAEQPAFAARAYGSIIDLYPDRVDLRRYAGARLERLGDHGAQLALDSYSRAAAMRPDHVTGHRLLAYALVKAERFDDAFAALVDGLEARRRGSSHADWVLRSDMGLVAAAWLRARPEAEPDVRLALIANGARLADEPSLRFVLNWETDVNDVDLHVYDADGRHAYHGNRHLPRGSLLEDVTTGWGPELFTIDDEGRSGGYFLQVHYYSRGPMGFGMGKVQIIEHDGKGQLRFDERPFIVTRDQAYVDIGKVGPWTRG